MRTSHFGTSRIVAAIAVFAAAHSMRGQDPAAPAQSPAVQPYRPPVIAVVQPIEGGSLPQDKPVVMMRFAAGEAGDPIDARSFAVSVDGEDQTHLFQVSATEAWGPLSSNPAELALGVHELAARICSTRGSCSSATAQVTVVKPAVAIAGAAIGKPVTTKKRVIDALLGALRTLLRQ